MSCILTIQSLRAQSKVTSNQLFKQFVTNFTKKLEGMEISEAEQNVDAGGMLKSVVKGFFGKKES